jgi:hypothetical protein
MDTRELLESSLNALDRLLKMFAIERYVYLVLTALSFVLLLYASYLFIAKVPADSTILISLFGSAGLITVSSARISWFFNRAFSLIENLIKKASK